jgi:hypothetical protein
VVERTLIRPPESRIGPITPQEREKSVKSSPVYGQYDEEVDRESAYEKLAKRAGDRAKAQEKAASDRAAEREARAAPRQRESATDRFIKNVAGSVGRQVGSIVVRSLVRGILGSLSRR